MGLVSTVLDVGGGLQCHQAEYQSEAIGGVSVLDDHEPAKVRRGKGKYRMYGRSLGMVVWEAGFRRADGPDGSQDASTAGTRQALGLDMEE